MKRLAKVWRWLCMRRCCRIPNSAHAWADHRETALAVGVALNSRANADNGIGLLVSSESKAPFRSVLELTWSMSISEHIHAYAHSKRA